MKYLLTLFALVFSIQIWAQDPILTDMDWYFYYLEVDGQSYEVPAPDPVAAPTLTFFDNGSGYEMTTYITEDSFFANVAIDQSAGTLTTSDSAITLFGCSQFCDLEAAYFDFLFKDGNPVTFNYIITIIDGPEDASYQLEIIDSDGDIAFYQNKFLSVPDQTDISITVFPNPVTHYLQIEAADTPWRQARILDLSGKEIQLWKHIEERLDVSNLSAGMYFLEIESSQGSSVQKFIKQ